VGSTPPAKRIASAASAAMQVVAAVAASDVWRPEGCADVPGVKADVPGVRVVRFRTPAATTGGTNADGAIVRVVVRGEGRWIGRVEVSRLLAAEGAGRSGGGRGDVDAAKSG